MTPTKALAQIEALPGQSNGMVPLHQLRAVLAQVQPEPVTLDRDKARDVLRQIRDVRAMNIGRFEQFLDALAVCVRPAPPHTIDRDALVELLGSWNPYPSGEPLALRADAVLALLRPVEGDELARMNRNLLSRIRELETERVEGVVITREEAEYAVRLLPTTNSQRARDLATRLEAAL